MKLAGQLGESKKIVEKRKKKTYDDSQRVKKLRKSIEHGKKQKKIRSDRAARAINKNPLSDRKRLIKSAQSAAKRPKG